MDDKIKNAINSCIDGLFGDTDERLSEKNLKYIPSNKEICDILEEIKKVLYPKYFSSDNNVSKEACFNQLSVISERLKKQIELAFSYEISQNCKNVFCCEGINEKATQVVCEFIKELPNVVELLKLDIQATLEGDPAAGNVDIILMTYPGIFAIYTYRLSHILYKLGVPLIPRIMTEYAHSKTGIDIHPGATIGKSFVIDHGTGIVIGETTEIGDGVKLYQGVTLGAISLKNAESLVGKKRHPTLKNNVTIYSGATVLGGNTVLGEGSIIGSSAFITKSVDDGLTVAIEKPKLRLYANIDGEKDKK
ncbi:MAG: serine acetyltransferase [Clostridia bacterium]|nr:serine acetyltransferase [Clostridia bacterium]